MTSSITLTRVLDEFDIAAPFAKRWDGYLPTATKIATERPRPRDESWT
jgi:hypothetical protein